MKASAKRTVFVAFSAELTGYTETDLEGTGNVDSFLDVLEQQAGATVRVLVRQFDVRVQPGGHDDVQVDLFGDARDPGDVAAQSPDGRIDDGADALGVQGVEAGARVGDPGLLVPPEPVTVVLLMLGGQHEDVLVHKGRPEVGDIDRIASKARFARMNGTAPIPASSGQTNRHRLNVGGNRRLNHALHMMALTQARMDPRARAYVERRRAEGRTRRDAIRALKRHLSDVVYQQLRADAGLRPDPLTQTAEAHLT